MPSKVRNIYLKIEEKKGEQTPQIQKKEKTNIFFKIND